MTKLLASTKLLVKHPTKYNWQICGREQASFVQAFQLFSSWFGWELIFTLIFWYKSTRVEHYAGKAEYRMHWTNRCARRSKIYLSRWSESIKYELCFDVKHLMINVYKYYSYDKIGCNTKDISSNLCDCTWIVLSAYNNIYLVWLFEHLF